MTRFGRRGNVLSPVPFDTCPGWSEEFILFSSLNTNKQAGRNDEW